MIVKSADSIVEPMENGPIVKKGTSNLADSIAQLDVFEENGSEKGSKMTQTLIKPMETTKRGLRKVFFWYEVFFGTYQKKCLKWKIPPGKSAI